MKDSMRTVLSIVLTTGLIIALSFPELSAQCPMCRIAAESNMENGGSAGNGLNSGIFYLLAAPYLIVGFIGFMWWRNNRTEESDKYPPSQG